MMQPEEDPQPQNRDTKTSVTLLLRLRDLTDRAAWTEFVDRYAPKVFAWCKRHQMQDTDAADVTQEVLCRLVERMRSFEYDPTRGSFRSWLKTVTTNLVRDLVRSWKQPVRGSGDTNILSLLSKIQDPDAFSDLASMMEAEYQRELLEEACERVKERVHAHTWRAYELTAIKQIKAADAAAEVNMSVAEVYVAKSRVIKMLRQEVEQLEARGESLTEEADGK